MIVRSGQPVTLRDIFDRFGLVSIQRRVRRYCRRYLKRRKHTFATLGVWSFLWDLAGRNEVLFVRRTRAVPSLLSGLPGGYRA